MSKWWSCGSNQESNSIFRSEVMSLVQMYLQPEAAYDTIAALGEVGVVQFRDVSDQCKKKAFLQESRNIMPQYIATQFNNSNDLTPGSIIPIPITA